VLGQDDGASSDVIVYGLTGTKYANLLVNLHTNPFARHLALTHHVPAVRRRIQTRCSDIRRD
jgi:hypothetical protein